MFVCVLRNSVSEGWRGDFGVFFRTDGARTIKLATNFHLIRAIPPCRKQIPNEIWRRDAGSHENMLFSSQRKRTSVFLAEDLFSGAGVASKDFTTMLSSSTCDDSSNLSRSKAVEHAPTNSSMMTSSTSQRNKMSSGRNSVLRGLGFHLSPAIEQSIEV